MPTALIVRSDSHDPWHNLALEEYIMHHMPDDHSVALYLWQNQNTVVIGRNQNAWAECRTGLLEEEGGKLARRTTGGGAVFHDLGNLNFSIILPKERFNLDNSFEIVLAAVRHAGIDAERSGRNDILHDGLKFSGNAFRTDKGFGLHHGTLLVHSAYERVARYLTVSPSKLQSKGIQSVRSRITNLQTIKPDVTVAAFEQTMMQAFLERLDHFGTFATTDWSIVHRTDNDFEKNEVFRNIERRFASWDWRYGQTIQFDVLLEQRFAWGMIRLGLVIHQGFVKKAQIDSDALDCDLISSLAPILEGRKFVSGELSQSLLANTVCEGGYGVPRLVMVQDLADLIREQNW